MPCPFSINERSCRGYSAQFRFYVELDCSFAQHLHAFIGEGRLLTTHWRRNERRPQSSDFRVNNDKNKKKYKRSSRFRSSTLRYSTRRRRCALWALLQHSLRSSAIKRVQRGEANDRRRTRCTVLAAPLNILLIRRLMALLLVSLTHSVIRSFAISCRLPSPVFISFSISFSFH